MSSMRLCLVAVAIFAGLSAAMSTCPYTNDVYNMTTGCGSCAEDYCTCIGGDCTVAAADCATAVRCARDQIKCMNDAADTLSCQSGLKNALLDFAASSAAAPVYNMTVLNKACKNAVCMTLSQSNTSDVCGMDIPYYATCVSPLAKTYTARLSGDFTAILNDPVKKAAFRVLLQEGMSTAIGRQVIITRMYAGSLVIEFYVDPAGLTAAQMATFEAAVATLATSTTWLTAALAYAEEQGVNIADVTVESIVDTTDGVQPPPTPSDDDEACGSGCVAGIVVAVVVVVIIVVIVVVFVTKKSPEEGDGQKSEPIAANEEMSKV